jgi:predicted membrane protein
MGKFLLYIFAALMISALVAFAIKVAIIVIILAGLIFRTRETVGFLAILLILGLIATFPWAALGVVIVLIIWAIIRASKKKPEAVEGEEA